MTIDDNRLTVRVNNEMLKSIDTEYMARNKLVKKTELIRQALAIGLTYMKQNRENRERGMI